MAQIMNFKKLEVTGKTREEALAQAPFDIMGDATQAYKNWRKKQLTGVTEADKKQFMLEYLAKKSKNCTGVGFYITMESAVADTRERPYKIEDVKNENGARTWKKQYKWIDRQTQTVVCTVDTKKSDAKNALKELYKSGAYCGNADLYIVKDVKEGQPIVATAEYTPSKSSRVGSYIVFGIERD